MKRKERKGEKEILVAGFPVNCLEKVEEKMKDAGILFSQVSDDDKLFQFSGADGTPEETLIDISRTIEIPTRITEMEDSRSLKELILSFNIGSSTPLDAMNFINCLQKRVIGEV